MSGARDLDPRSVLNGAVVGLVLTVPSGLIAGSLEEDNNLVILFTLLVLIAPFLAGAVASRHHRRPHAAGADVDHQDRHAPRSWPAAGPLGPRSLRSLTSLGVPS